MRRPSPTAAARCRQPTPQELTDSLLGFLRSKFYAGDDQSFFQDRSRLLAWVVLWPASWLNSRGVTIHGDQYRKIFLEVFSTAAAHANDKIKYRPAWMKMVIQSHFRIHGERYYEAAKSVRNLTEHIALLAGKSVAPAADPVKDLAAARQLIALPKRQKAVKITPVNDQLPLL